MPPFRLFPALVVTVFASGAVQAQQGSLTAAEAVLLAQANNPDLQMLVAEVDTAKARLAGASLLFQGNPSLTAAVGPRSSPLGNSRDESLQLLQPIEIGGQRGARVEAAEALVDVAEGRLRARRGEIAAASREAYGRAFAAEQRARLAAEALAVAQEGVAAAQERFEAGAAALLEVNTARVELGRMARDRSEAERRNAEALGDLHLLLGLDPARIPVLQGELGVEERGVLEERQLIERALANRAEIAISRRALEAATAQARLTIRERIPTPKIGVSYTREEESDTEIVQGLLSFDLPLFNRNQEARGVAAARVSQLETEVAATIRRVRQEVSTAVSRLRAARSAADGFAGDVVKAMQENMELGLESYRAGKIDFLQLLLIRRQALEARNEHIDVLEELNAARAQLDRAIGVGQ
jgi:outer membrane protein, heavy metal efflux system